MKINLNLLPKVIDTDIDFPSSFWENSDIVNLKNIHVSGSIYYNLSDEVEIDFKLTGIMQLKDSINLDIIDYPIDLKIKENLEEIASESTFFYEKNKNTLDIIEFLWENIVLEVPISITGSTGANLKGEGWELNKDDGEEEIDTRFLKLNDFFKGGE